MAERKLESKTVRDNRLFLYDFPLQGFSLKFVSGPPEMKDIKPGCWLDMWEIVDDKRRFTFGPWKNLAFASKQAATDAQAELKKAVDIITEVTE